MAQVDMCVVLTITINHIYIYIYIYILVHKRIYWIRTIVRMAQHSNIIFTLRIINLRMRNPIYRHFVFFV